MSNNKLHDPIKIIVIGGGFAGINIIKSLAESEEFNITLVDKNNYNFFPPLIYYGRTRYRLLRIRVGFNNKLIISRKNRRKINKEIS
ncbi:FAD/NAD(P)-binding protein [Sphingobacterium lactis]|uniref:FAD/NAD(P)-binding protein n=1 Tax=Sphingobacterium TaxID=28453 RepID=UPI00257FF060|nr:MULTISPECIES: hypothetical protein [Sphingobacterium]